MTTTSHIPYMHHFNLHCQQFLDHKNVMFYHFNHETLVQLRNKFRKYVSIVSNSVCHDESQRHNSQHICTLTTNLAQVMIT